MKPLFGYPGGKSRAASKIKAALGWDEGQYNRIVEPFCGGASFSLSCGLPAWINDCDVDLYCLWLCVRDYPDELCERVRNYELTSDTFYTLRDKLKTPRRVPKAWRTVLSRGIDKLVVHKISYSNMGEMSGSPVGGKNQTGAWKFDVRWNVDSICKQIHKTSARIQGWQITYYQYWEVFKHLKAGDFVFIDPPYVEAGKKCYKHAFDEGDHEGLANSLFRLGHDWALTYDNCDLVTELYEWANVDSLAFNYGMSTAYRAGKDIKKGDEVLITP